MKLEKMIRDRRIRVRKSSKLKDDRTLLINLSIEHVTTEPGPTETTGEVVTTESQPGAARRCTKISAGFSEASVSRQSGRGLSGR
jgi:hypothetical protein